MTLLDLILDPVFFVKSNFYDIFPEILLFSNCIYVVFRLHVTILIALSNVFWLYVHSSFKYINLSQCINVDIMMDNFFPYESIMRLKCFWFRIILIIMKGTFQYMVWQPDIYLLILYNSPSLCRINSSLVLDLWWRRDNLHRTTCVYKYIHKREPHIREMNSLTLDIRK